MPLSEMALFDGGNDPRTDLATLATATRDALAATRFADRFQALFELVSDGLAWRAVGHLRAKRLPVAALALSAGAGAIGVGKPYAVRPAWNAGLALRRGRPPHHPVRPLSELDPVIAKLTARMHDTTDAAAYGRDEGLVGVAYAERWVAELLEKRAGAESAATRASLDACLEEARWDLAEALGRRAGGAPEPSLARAALRVAPVGAGDAGLADCAEDRPTLYAERSAGPAWEGLLLAIDACGGGSHAALEALGRFARAHEALGWPLWLDEVACAVADDPRRGDSARRLDACLRDEPCARELLELHRASVERHLPAARDAWLTLAARREPALEPPGDFMESLAEERARRDAGLPGRFDHELFRVLERTLAESRRETRLEQDRRGPFYDLRIDPPLERTLGAPLASLLLGFRTLFGAELAREALAALAN